jgi:hypothetical protein
MNIIFKKQQVKDLIRAVDGKGKPGFYSEIFAELKDNQVVLSAGEPSFIHTDPNNNVVGYLDYWKSEDNPELEAEDIWDDFEGFCAYSELVEQIEFWLNRKVHSDFNLIEE